MHSSIPPDGGRSDVIPDLFQVPAGIQGEDFTLRPLASASAQDVTVDVPTLEPLDPDHLLARAREAAAQDRRADSEALYRELLTLEPGHVGGIVGLAALLEGHDPGAALGLLASALKPAPDSPELLLARAGIRRRQKELADAEVDARRVLKVHPNHPDGLFELGLVLLRKGLAAEAGQVLMRRVEQRPDDADCWYYIGEARNQAGNLPAALEALQRAARLDERDTRTFNLMGRVLDRMGRPDEAMEMYRRSRELA